MAYTLSTRAASRFGTARLRLANASIVSSYRHVPTLQEIDFVEVSEALHDAGFLILYGVSGVLDAYEEWQHYT